MAQSVVLVFAILIINFLLSSFHLSYVVLNIASISFENCHIVHLEEKEEPVCMQEQEMAKESDAEMKVDLQVVSIWLV